MLGFEFYVIMGLICGSMSLILAIVLEAVCLYILKWQTFWRSFCDSFLVNLVTAVLGCLLWGLWVSIKGKERLLVVFSFIPMLVYAGLFATTPWIIAWGLSVVTEGALLWRIRRQSFRKTFLAALAANLVSYLALYGFWHWL
jgi:TctA family transporter